MPVTDLCHVAQRRTLTLLQQKSIRVSANLTGAILCVPLLEERGRVIGRGRKEGEKDKALKPCLSEVRSGDSEQGVLSSSSCSPGQSLSPGARSINEPSRLLCTTTRRGKAHRYQKVTTSGATLAAPRGDWLKIRGRAGVGASISEPLRVVIGWRQGRRGFFGRLLRLRMSSKQTSPPPPPAVDLQTRLAQYSE